MPRTRVVARRHDRSRSLGWLMLAWMEHFCVHGPGDVQGEPVSHGDEYSGIVADCYAVDPDGRLMYDSAFVSRPKGCDKSGMGARFGLGEAFGPCRFAGFAEGGEVYRDPWGLGFAYAYEPGEPMGRPVKVPFIRCLATEEGQTGLVYDTVHFNLTEGLLKEVPGVDVGLTRVLLPGGGEITPSTAASASKDGGKETFVCFDETHLYNQAELRQMYRTVTRNLRKRKKIAGTWYLETTTMFAQGEDSVAEDTYRLAQKIKEGTAARERLFYDHQWGECDDVSDEDELRRALAEAYGDALEWNDLGGLVDEFFEARNEVADSRRYFLNAETATSDAWLSQSEWAGCADPLQVVGDDEPVTLGFDGSRKRARGVTDATALVGCRVSDGHLFEIAVWEQPAGPAGRDWQVPRVEVSAAVRAAFTRYQVVGFYADPAKWESYVAEWEGEFSSRLRVKASRDHPIEWWMTGGRAVLTVRALERLRNAVVERELTHDGSFAMTRHFLNARMRMSKQGVQIAKANPDSPLKIDAAVAGTLAFEARADALATGVGSAARSKRLVRY